MTKLMMFAASLRSDSVNKKLISKTAQLAKKSSIDVDVAEFSEFSAPLYNQDDQETHGIPDSVKAFIDRMNKSDGLVIASPEYNYSIPGTLKNLIDWVSRDKPMPWKGQHVLLLSASPALVGGNRGQWATRIPLEGCGAFVFPQMYSLPNAYEAFNDSGDFNDSKNDERISSLLDAFVSEIKR